MSFTGPELCARTAVEVVQLLKARKVTPMELVEASASRIAQVEPAVNATVTTCIERARAHARRIEAERHDWSAPGALAGLPVGIKDLNAVAGVRTTWGTRAFADFVPDESDPLVERLEARGGIVMGKTNSPEMGAGANTFNAVFGATRNPWDTRLNAGGSSGGAAVSLATGEVWLSHASDLAGSGRTPAAYCGVVGLRPTPGRAGGGPALVAFEREAISGPMARNVADCALFLDAMTGWDPRMPISMDAPPTPFLDAARAEPGAIRVALAITLGGLAPVEASIAGPIADAMTQLQSHGIRVAEACPDLTVLNRTYDTLRGIHYAALLDRMPEDVKTHFKDTLKGNIAAGLTVTAQDIYDAMRARTELYHRMRAFLERFDVLACAVIGTPPGPVEEEYPKTVAGQPVGDYIEWLRFSCLSVVTGLPAIAMPCGFTRDGLPVGVQLIGRPRGDARLLQVARRFEEIWGCAARVPIDPVVRH